MYMNEYDPFNFMIVLLFIYAVLIGFIMMIIYNNIHSSKSELVSALTPRNKNGNGNDNTTQTTCANCIPSPTPIKGQRV